VKKLKALLINVTKGYLFLSLRKKLRSTETSFCPPIGILYIASSLEEEGYTVEVIDFFCERSPEETLQESLKSTDVVGICVYTKYRNEAAKIAHSIKKEYPSMPIIIGGPHCIFHPDRALCDIPEADICVEGEGEQTIKYVIKALNGKKRLTEIPGIYYRLDLSPFLHFLLFLRI